MDGGDSRPVVMAFYEEASDGLLQADDGEGENGRNRASQQETP